MRSEEIFANALKKRAEQTGPRIGDYVDILYAQGKMPRRERIICEWPDDMVQTTGGGSFYLGDSFVSGSGDCNPAIPRSELELREYEEALGWFWFFARNYRQAGNRVEVVAPCRIFTYKPKEVWGQ